MHDGQTRKIERRPPPKDGADFFATHAVSLIVLSGSRAGSDYALDKLEVTVGRGADADLGFDDDAMSREHAAFELSETGFRVRDLGSTNGVRVNGHPTLSADLKHGDKIEIGDHSFQYLQEDRAPTPRAYDLSDE